jgi:hypothetical protein
MRPPRHLGVHTHTHRKDHVVTVRIAAKFAKDKQDLNGLDPISDQISSDSHSWTGVAVVLLDCIRVTDEVDQGGVLIPTVRVKHIEPLGGEDADNARKLLNTAYEARTGRTPLPIDEAGKIPAEYDTSLCGPVYADDAGRELYGFCIEPAGHEADKTPHRYRDEWTDTPTTPGEGA